MSSFEIGKVYYATPTMKGLKRKIVIPIGREGCDMQIAFIEGIDVAKIVRLDGREFIQFKTEIGDYGASSACEASAEDAAIINDILKHRA